MPEPNAEFKTATTVRLLQRRQDRARQFRGPEPAADHARNRCRTPSSRPSWPRRTAVLDRQGDLRSRHDAPAGPSPRRQLQGGSTITQQYIKVLYLNSEQTLARKFKELFLAYKINNQLSKEEILEGYLNTIYFGHGAYGIQAASQAYFNVDAKELSVRRPLSSPP